MTPEERERKRRIWRDYKLRKKAGLTKTQEQAERESMAILRANQAAEAARKRDEAARQKREKEKKAAEELVAQTELEALNRVCGTSFCYGQCVLVTCGRRARVKGATPSRLLVHLFSGEVLLVSPHDVWSMVELSKQAAASVLELKMRQFAFLWKHQNRKNAAAFRSFAALRGNWGVQAATACILPHRSGNRVLGREVRQAGLSDLHQTPGRRHGAGLCPQEV